MFALGTDVARVSPAELTSRRVDTGIVVRMNTSLMCITCCMFQDHYLEVHYGISPPVRNPGAFESRVESPHNPWEAFGFDLSLVMDTRPANDTRPFVIQFLESISCPTGVKSESYDYQKHVKVFEKFGLRRHEDFKRVIGPGLDCVEQIGMELKKDGLPPFR